MADKIAKEKYSGKFRISLVDAESHKMLWTRRFTTWGIVVTLISAFVVLGAIFFVSVAYTPLKNLIPGYPDAATRQRYANTSATLDSLETKLLQWDVYAENLRSALTGGPALSLDSLKAVSAARGPEGDRQWLRSRDSLLRAVVEGAERFEISGRDKALPIDAMPFFTPLKGVVSQGYDPKSHPWIDVTAPSGSAVMSVLEGTVIFALWDDDEGYTVAIQHPGDIVSIYKHNQKLLKKAGDKVDAGTPVAILGGSASITTGDHLRFELWYRGTEVDPQRYINF